MSDGHLSAIVVVVPLTPIGAAFGINPISGHHFPGKLGVGLPDASGGDESFSCVVPVLQALVGVSRSIIPILLVLLAGVLCITYVPWLTTALPRAFGR